MTQPDDTPRSVLLVDDDESFRSTLARAFKRRGWDVSQAENAIAALALARKEAPEHAVVDLVLQNGDGLSLVRELVALDASTRVILLTGFASVATAIEAIRCGAVHYLSKPVDVGEIIAAFERGDEPSAPPVEVPSLGQVEWEHIQRVLHSCGGNVTRAAQLLGIHRRSLQRKLRRPPSPRRG